MVCFYLPAGSREGGLSCIFYPTLITSTHNSNLENTMLYWQQEVPPSHSRGHETNLHQPPQMSEELKRFYHQWGGRHLANHKVSLKRALVVVRNCAEQEGDNVREAVRQFKLGWSRACF